MVLLGRNPKLSQWKFLYSLVVEWLLSWLALSIRKAIISDKGFAVVYFKPQCHCGRTCTFLVHLINCYMSSFPLYAEDTAVTVSVLGADGASRTFIVDLSLCPSLTWPLPRRVCGCFYLKCLTKYKECNTEHRRGENFLISTLIHLRARPTPGRDISQYQYFINKWVILHQLALEHCWRRSINPRMPQSSCICQSQPELMTLPISQSGPSTHSLSGLIW